MSWREAVVAEAHTWIGTPYVAKGRIKGVGVDCGGLIYAIYEPHFGPFKPFPTDYTPDWCRHSDAERYLNFILPHVEEVSYPRLGGIAVFHVGNAYAHGAIYVGNNNYIHARGRNGVGCVMQTKSRALSVMSEIEPKFFEPRQ